jgi:hypothetical protein
MTKELNNERLGYLLAYLDKLISLTSTNMHVFNEIEEVLKALQKELDLPIS